MYNRWHPEKIYSVAWVVPLKVCMIPFHSKIHLKETETLNILNVRALRILIFLVGFSDFSGVFKNSKK